MSVVTRWQWFYPGVGLKRWLVLLVLGVVVAFSSFLLVLSITAYPELRGHLGFMEPTGAWWATALVATLGLALGGVACAYGILGVFRFSRSAASPSIAEIRSAGRLARGPRVVAIGGGTGLSALLRGLKHHSSNLTAVVTVADDGGSSGLLRRDMGVLPPGDIRNCLVALADDESLMSRLFQYRFPNGGLGGHSFGNLFLAALAEVTGDFELAVQESTGVLKVRGRVLPATLEDVVLHAQLEGGRRVTGESTITASDRLPLRVWLTPEAPAALPQSISAIEEADVVVLGPGSVYTSIVPNLLIPDVRAALRRTRAPVVYVCNVMTQPGETDGYTAADHAEALYRHGAAGLIDEVLVNDTHASPAMVAAYERLGAQPVAVDDDRLAALGVHVVHARLAAEGDFFRHDSALLAEVILAEARR